MRQRKNGRELGQIEANSLRRSLGRPAWPRATENPKSWMAAHVQVFGRRNAKTIHALMQPASEKRQGTKSRWVGHRRCRKLYGDFAASSGSKGMRRSGRADGFAPRRGCACSAERSDRRFVDQNGAGDAGQSDGSTQAGALPVESRREWRVLLGWRIGSDGIMRCRS
jgi:hypothetical protein